MATVTVPLDDYLWYVDQALDSMAAIVSELGDDLVNERPDLPRANSAYAIVTHCLGVMADWGGYAICGRQVQRDRPAEFVATGPVAELLESVAVGRDRLVADLESLESAEPPRGAPKRGDLGRPLARTQGGVAWHIYEELSQHLGHLELTRDIVRQQATLRSSGVG
jgi:hypothetical protein